MLFSIIFSYLAYALVTAFTPGPNNVVALYAISQQGWRKGKNVLFGMSIGFLAVMVICALLCYELTRFLPSATGVLKYVGAVYIAYLAIHIALSKPNDEESKQMTFMKGFFLQFVNVKIILYAITIYTGYVIPHDGSLATLLIHSVAITIIGIAGNMTWATAGGVFQRLLRKYYRPFNIAMGLVLLWCAVSLVI